MKNNLTQLSILTLFTFVCSPIYAQENDSVQNLESVLIQSFQRTTPLIEATTSISKVNQNILNLNHPERLVESINIIPGAKMEERSPGSYRLSLRGSTIRSPFGVRNVKIFFDDFVLTDATGNSYLNLIEPNFLQSIELRKGPQGGEFGSESGGIVVLNSINKDEIKTNISGGSYNMFAEKINFGKKIGKHFLQIGQSHYQSDGYREQSKIKRTSFIVKNNWKYNQINELKFLLLYTDLDYQTPGGLTLQQMRNNPRQARLATSTLPSVIEQNAAIRNKTFLGGIAHVWKINENWKQFTMLQSSFTDFKNPFISNFEIRDEKNFQGRMYLDYSKELNNIKLNTRIGIEAGINKTDFNNYDNNAGIKGNPQKFDQLKSTTTFYYLAQHLELKNKLFIDASLSLNTMQYNWTTTFPLNDNGAKSFKNQLLPQIGVNYKLNSTLSLRGKIAKGFSSPTTEEVRSSNQEIQSNLSAEHGWNKEIGIRKNLKSIFVELTAFNYNLKDAIVKRQDENGNDYFINAGGTKQQGLEISIESNKFKFNHPIFNGYNFILTGHFYDFKYNNYQVGLNNFSNNKLPGISKYSVQNLIELRLFNLIDLQYSNYYNSSLYLNDANSVKEKDYIIGNLLINSDLKIRKSNLNLYFGINNLYNTKYSAGYDLNAFGNRYYNPAATRNFYIGMKIIL